MTFVLNFETYNSFLLCREKLFEKDKDVVNVGPRTEENV